MTTQDLFDLADDPRFISGIHNYCDRWCERCRFTSRCRVFAMEEKDRDDPSTRDISDEAFWKELTEIFQRAKEMLDDLAQENGFALNDDEQERIVDERRRRREQAENHELAIASQRYANMVDEWFEAERELFEHKRDELITMAELEIGDLPPESVADQISDTVEVISWYQHQIHVKLMRALMRFDCEDDLEDEPSLQDSDGSAKVALIGMDRSIAAWGALREHFPEKTDSILTLLLHLDRLRRKTEQHFPAARSFVRPGFDEIPGKALQVQRHDSSPKRGNGL